ncbi:MAG: alkaline phosphatase family protein [Solirubrobacteraceae bacterium]
MPGRMLAVAAGVVFVVVLAGGMGPASGASNLLVNGTFEGTGSGSVSGWSGMNATVAVGSDGVGGGHAAAVRFTSGATTYSMNASPKPVSSTTAGTRYIANGVFRSDTPGQTICVRVKEYNSSNIGQGQGEQCAVATSSWQAFPAVDYTSIRSGDSIAVRIYQQANAAAGQSFEVDNLSLISGSADTTPPSVPTGLTAAANGPTEIDLDWSASSDPGGGVAGYTIYRNGTAVGTSTTTSFADAGLTARTTYSYTVDAVDTSQNHSAQSSPSVSATTAPDTTVPTAPASLTATAISASRIDLSWTASSDPDGVGGYRIFRGGVKIAELTSGLTYSDTSVVPSTAYSYTVRAFDSVNESPDSPVATATTPAASGDPIKHVVVIYQENNSFDEVLGYTCAVTLAGRCDGATTGKVSNGTTVPLAQPPDIVPTVNHSPGSITTAIDGGKMDGFDKNSGCAAPAYACYVSYRPSQIPNLSMYAQQYVVADRTFESKVSASWGSHLDLVSSTLDGFQGVNPSHAQFATKGWGCDSGATAPWKNPQGGGLASNQPTCIPDFSLNPTQYPHGGAFEATSVAHVPTIMDEMNAAGVSWHIYAPTASQQFYGWAICPSFADCLYTNQEQSTSQPSQVLTDAANGTLPSVSYVVALDNQSQHNSNSMLAGDNWIGSVVNSIMNGPDWRSTAIFITYDDCGCFYDHVPPPAGAGVREPMVIVSPCAKPAYTDHNTAYAGDSTLAFIEHTFNLPALIPTADGSAYDYNQSFNYTQPGCGGAGTAPTTLTRATIHPITAAEKAYIKAHPANPNDPS